ncbi:metallophosphoesterase [Paenibacillus sp. B01]|uniref:metallophosphoesterase n=1 Tax=Paenibacillus sp. B01 TaxID=2660554 RepID=UPI00129B71AF|nr:metallophosphoesterase [Paenibacillus sp. B01]QGG56717.1 metallophosphoesterase [Paenibacillus sp. B01]
MHIMLGIVFLLLYGGLVWYVGWSGWRWLRPAAAAWFRVLYIAGLSFLALSFFLGRFFPEQALISRIGSYWLALFALLLMVLPVAQLLLLLLRLTRIPRHRAEKWGGALTLAVLLGLLAFGSYQAYSPVVRTYEVRVDKPAGGLEELNVVMAADMHFGLLSGPAHAERLVREIEKLQPDLVLFPGDIIDDDLELYESSGIGEILARIQAPYGVYATLGNHDKFDGPTERIIESLEASGMQVLYDEVVTIEDKLTLIGRKDRTEQDRAPLAELAAQADPSKPLFLLDHQPYELDIAARSGIDLMVSGHTHRGQIAPGHLITGAIYENDWGVLRKEQMTSVVTSGFGFWGPPIRLGSRSEVVQLRLVFS